jgi:two-component system sensor histidine kinase/response regulator
VSGHAESNQPVPSGLRGFDIPAALRRLAGNEPLLHKLAADFVREYGGAAGRIAEALGRGEREAARAEAHGLAGVASTLAARDVYSATVALEGALAGDGPYARELATLQAALAEVHVPGVAPGLP